MSPDTVWTLQVIAAAVGGGAAFALILGAIVWMENHL